VVTIEHKAVRHFHALVQIHDVLAHLLEGRRIFDSEFADCLAAESIGTCVPRILNEIVEGHKGFGLCTAL
jgi:hypothetical protein